MDRPPQHVCFVDALRQTPTLKMYKKQHMSYLIDEFQHMERLHSRWFLKRCRKASASAKTAEAQARVHKAALWRRRALIHLRIGKYTYLVGM